MQRLLEDVHGLQRERVDEAEVGGHLGEPGLVREPFELVVEVVLGVADLVDAQLLRLRQLAVGAERVLLEEAPRGRAAVEELLVRLRSCSLVVKIVRSLLGCHSPTISMARLQLGTRRGVDETLDHEVPSVRTVRPADCRAQRIVCLSD